MEEQLAHIKNGVTTGSTSSNVQVASCTLAELLNTYNKEIEGTGIKGQLMIPEYQRPYVWREKQIDALLHDFIEYKENKEENKPQYYLGSIILHQDGNQLKIIDGQQRITTALLIQKIVNPSFQSGITYNASISINNIQRNLSYLSSIANRQVFDFREHDVLKYLDFDSINVTLIVTNTEDLAYTFFETQNTGGVRLAGSDILKAHHLRAIDCRKTVNYQAKRWESIDSKNVEKIVQLLTKIRFWDNRKWRQFPFYRNSKELKEVIIDEYTLNTLKTKVDISYYYSAVKNEQGRMLQMHESTYKQLKQPLEDGNNTLDYVNEYIQLYEMLFGTMQNHHIPDEFYEFRNRVLHGRDGTLFLKELFEIALISYVSRFGFHRLYEASLWLYRVIYSIRVSNSRNVREDSVFKFVYENQFVDNIIEVFTPDELFLFLKKFRYKFNTDNTGANESKGKHVRTLCNYFRAPVQSIETYKKNPDDFDNNLMEAIANKIEQHG